MCKLTSDRRGRTGFSETGTTAICSAGRTGIRRSRETCARATSSYCSSRLIRWRRTTSSTRRSRLFVNGRRRARRFISIRLSSPRPRRPGSTRSETRTCARGMASPSRGIPCMIVLGTCRRSPTRSRPLSEAWPQLGASPPQSTKPPRPKVSTISNIPIRVPPLFMGRDDALAAIETGLRRYEGRVAITALHGLRGVGKTTLAAAFAERHRGTYRATWWIRAQTEPTLRADLVALGVRLGWVDTDDKEEPALAATLERLRYEGEGILLIFDNATTTKTLSAYLPQSGAAHVLVISDAHDSRGFAELVELHPWSKEIGADYLIAYT